MVGDCRALQSTREKVGEDCLEYVVSQDEYRRVGQQSGDHHERCKDSCSPQRPALRELGPAERAVIPVEHHDSGGQRAEDRRNDDAMDAVEAAFAGPT